jgi:hypothetical protein
MLLLRINNSQLDKPLIYNPVAKQIIQLGKARVTLLK